MKKTYSVTLNLELGVTVENVTAEDESQAIDQTIEKFYKKDLGLSEKNAWMYDLALSEYMEPNVWEEK